MDDLLKKTKDQKTILELMDEVEGGFDPAEIMKGLPAPKNYLKVTDEDLEKSRSVSALTGELIKPTGYNVFMNSIFSKEYVEEKQKKEKDFLNNMNLTKMVAEHESDFGKNENCETKPDTNDPNSVDNKQDIKLFCIEGTGTGMNIKEVPYFSNEAKELLAKKGGVINKKKELNSDENNLESFLKNIGGEQVNPYKTINNNENDQNDANVSSGRPGGQNGPVKHSKAMLYARNSDSSDDPESEGSCDFPMAKLNNFLDQNEDLLFL